jgi:hypothetical protein
MTIGRRISLSAAAGRLIDMGTKLARGWVTAAMIAGTLAATPAWAQESAPAAVPALAPSETQMAQIRRALGQPTVLRLDDRQLRFYLEVVGRQPHKFSAAEFFKGYDLINGPTPRGNPMSHQEFLDMVNPRELHSTAGITPAEMLQFAMTNWLGQSLIKKALEDVRNARNDKEVQEIRERIDRELAALRGAGSSQ